MASLFKKSEQTDFKHQTISSLLSARVHAQTQTASIISSAVSKHVACSSTTSKHYNVMSEELKHVARLEVAEEMMVATTGLARTYETLSKTSSSLFGLKDSGGTALVKRGKDLALTTNAFKATVQALATTTKKLDAETKKYDPALGPPPQSLLDCQIALTNEGLAMGKEVQDNEERRAVDTKLLYEDLIRKEIALHMIAAELLSENLKAFREVNIDEGGEFMKHKMMDVETGGGGESVPQQATKNLQNLSPKTIANLKPLLIYIEENASEEVGIYRVSGRSTVVKSLYSRVIDPNEPAIHVDDVPELCGFDANVCAGVVGRVLSSHRPVLPYRLNQQVMAIRGASDVEELLDEWEVEEGENKQILILMLKHLNYVADREDSNKMGLEQLALCVGGKLFREDEEGPTDMTKTKMLVKEKCRVFVIMGDFFNRR
jgi:hypothetical protein